MKKIKLIIYSLTCLSFISFLIGCEKNVNSSKSDNIEIVKNDSDTHYLRFMENNAEILRLVVLENETYEDLLPYFPTLTQESGYIKFWDGDYTFTSYSKENQFQIYSSTNLIVDIYSYIMKI